MPKQWKIAHFLQKLKKVVSIVLYGPAISQSDGRKTGPYQLPSNNTLLIYLQLVCNLELSFSKNDQNKTLQNLG